MAASESFDPVKVQKCLVQAGLEEWFASLPEGTETCLYHNFSKKGIEISGGEAQKIALARALYKDAPFIVLDEPTAALDPVSEYEIYSRFNEIVGEKQRYISLIALLPAASATPLQSLTTAGLSSEGLTKSCSVLPEANIVNYGMHRHSIIKNRISRLQKPHPHLPPEAANLIYKFIPYGTNKRRGRCAIPQKGEEPQSVSLLLSTFKHRIIICFYTCSTFRSSSQ